MYISATNNTLIETVNIIILLGIFIKTADMLMIIAKYFITIVYINITISVS